ncbi:arylamine N-acetyltransferase [Amorphoplanes digitatis]|uniref:N-hydroxyarylamine O-acetyltransferase n=1 Tax=Actinoplanes digitatis TaxID=1868 RepID=A0A7W7I1P7_9ACTN|nr:arylamine N-acetyltransferase [Actinoplanes digitatis]MBB4764817.1 N-hydroxyarylamine O-acetyltransferase [Actinoplanes digitatis]GID91230.1 arylamine N-acetyltransferase [Actinoplanes digitatis]
MTEKNHDFDLDGYLRRIGWRGAYAADSATLRAVHRAHALSIPFENMDVFLFHSVPPLALSALEEKVLRGRRGGSCYEHNTLLAAALRSIGFRVTYLTGRVLALALGQSRLPRTHMLLLVHVPGEQVPYLADVGFGLPTALLQAVPLLDGVESVQDGRRFRLYRTPRTGLADAWVLQTLRPSAWVEQYEFTLEPFEEIDISVINWHVATNPVSPARQDLYVGIARPDGHLGLAGRKLFKFNADGTREQRVLGSQEELARVLADEFAIDVPDGARWPAWPAEPVPAGAGRGCTP